MDVLHNRFSTAIDQLVAIGFGLLEAILVYGVAWLFMRIVRRPVRRRLRRSPLPDNIKALLFNAFRFAVFLVATTLIMAVWGVTVSGFLAAVSISTIIVALGFQAALQSLLAGIFILLERPFGVGDRIKFSGQEIEGVVEEIGLRSLVLRSDRGERTTAPNSLIFTLGVSNLTPNRTAKTVVRIRDVPDDEEDVRRTIDHALASETGLAKPQEIRFRSRLARTRPTPDAPESDFQAALSRVTQSVVTRARDADVIWAGTLDAASIGDAKSRLQDAFPNSVITVQHR